MTPGTSRRMFSTPQKQPPASTATSVCFSAATAARVLSCSFMSALLVRRSLHQKQIPSLRARATRFAQDARAARVCLLCPSRATAPVILAPEARRICFSPCRTRGRTAGQDSVEDENPHEAEDGPDEPRIDTVRGPESRSEERTAELQ